MPGNLVVESVEDAGGVGARIVPVAGDRIGRAGTGGELAIPDAAQRFSELLGVGIVAFVDHSPRAVGGDDAVRGGAQEIGETFQQFADIIGIFDDERRRRRSITVVDAADDDADPIRAQQLVHRFTRAAIADVDGEVGGGIGAHVLQQPLHRVCGGFAGRVEVLLPAIGAEDLAATFGDVPEAVDVDPRPQLRESSTADDRHGTETGDADELVTQAVDHVGRCSFGGDGPVEIQDHQRRPVVESRGELMAGGEGFGDLRQPPESGGVLRGAAAR